MSSAVNAERPTLRFVIGRIPTRGLDLFVTVGCTEIRDDNPLAKWLDSLSLEPREAWSI